MKPKKKIIAALAVVLVVAVLWSYSFMTGQRVAATYGQEDLQSSKRIAAFLKELNQENKVASDHEHRSDEIAGLIENAARTSGIPAASIQRIMPKPARKIPDTSYNEKPTELTLRNITLKQLCPMAKTICSPDKNLYIKSIKLTSPRDKDTGNKWNAELVVSYLIYDPENDKR